MNFFDVRKDREWSMRIIRQSAVMRIWFDMAVLVGDEVVERRWR